MKSLAIAKTPSESNLRHRLREETADIHHALHRNVGLQTLASDECSKTNYLNSLNLFFIFYTASDNQFNFITEQQRFIHEANPLSWLKKDYSALNQPIPDRSFSFLTDLLNHSFQPTFENYIGYLYVKQGSTLGGQTISKQLKKTLSLEPGVNQFFFYGFGEETGNYWKQFLNYLSHYEDDLDADQVIKSARDYFSALDQFSTRYFSQGGLHGQ
ncbi:MAG TPA: biliverdin-producing heme oxygenase [Cellvibrio sp.]|nr:biliverdin-producing heme oxygenase [Cellvibrio sp.]